MPKLLQYGLRIKFPAPRKAIRVREKSLLTPLESSLTQLLESTGLDLLQNPHLRKTGGALPTTVNHARFQTAGVLPIGAIAPRIPWCNNHLERSLLPPGRPIRKQDPGNFSAVPVSNVTKSGPRMPKFASKASAECQRPSALLPQAASAAAGKAASVRLG